MLIERRDSESGITVVSTRTFQKESDYTGANFYYQMPFISSNELCPRI